MNYIIGITATKRSGKDSLCKGMIDVFADKGILAKRYAFADELKKELNPLFLLNSGVSAFTEDEVEKELVRPTLIAYGTGFWRKKDPYHWLKKVESAIKKDKQPHIAIIPDVRFPEDEGKWVKDNGFLIHLTRFDDDCACCPPAGEDEAFNDPILKKMSNYCHEWETFGEDNLVQCYYHARWIVDSIFTDKISQWQNDFPIPTQN